jgi:hypothetical protein
VRIVSKRLLTPPYWYAMQSYKGSRKCEPYSNGLAVQRESIRTKKLGNNRFLENKRATRDGGACALLMRRDWNPTSL